MWDSNINSYLYKVVGEQLIHLSNLGLELYHREFSEKHKWINKLRCGYLFKKQEWVRDERLRWDEKLEANEQWPCPTLFIIYIYIYLFYFISI